jgi:endonuclease/exonuclease/phosphatase family metal-dependent hydrolase
MHAKSIGPNMTRQPRYILFLLLFLFTCQSNPPDQTGFGGNTLRILDINVWSGLDYRGILKMGEYETAKVREKRYQALLAQIRELNPDIIGIHEANKLPGYAKRLAKDIGFACFYHVGLGGIRFGPVGLPRNLREGDAILVRKSLHPEFVGRRRLSGGYVGNWLTFHFSDATQIIAVKITLHGNPVFLYATHWHASLSDSPHILARARLYVEAGEAGEEEYRNTLARIQKNVDLRLTESEKTVEFIRKTAGNHPVILMGDFNAEQGSREIRHLLKSGMTDTFRFLNADSPGYTSDPDTNRNYRVKRLKEKRRKEPAGLYAKLESVNSAHSKRIDYIFAGPSQDILSGKVFILSSEVVMKKIINGVHASDHYGVLAAIAIIE